MAHNHYVIRWQELPQGSVIRPLLFQMTYIPKSILYSSTYFSADNAKLVKDVCSTRGGALLQSDIDAFSVWSVRHGMCPSTSTNV